VKCSNISLFTGWFTTFFKDAVDHDDNFDSRPGANLFIKHVKYESLPGAKVASVSPSQEASHPTKPTDTESVPFEDIIVRNDDGGVKQVDSEEEELKKRYEEGGGVGAGDDAEHDDTKEGGVAEDDEGGGGNEKIVDVAATNESTTNSPDCLSKK